MSTTNGVKLQFSRKLTRQWRHNRKTIEKQLERISQAIRYPW